MLFDRPDCSTLLYLFAFPRYLSLYRQTIQANLLSALPSIHNQSLTITCMVYGGIHAVRTISDSHPSVIGIDGTMSIINMLRFLLCTCLVMRKLFELCMLLSNLCTQLYITCIDFILTYVTGV
ncbi:hypothetical protein Hanom_Chr12g01155031 [Helianthus anomalus]